MSKLANTQSKPKKEEKHARLRQTTVLAVLTLIVLTMVFTVVGAYFIIKNSEESVVSKETTTSTTSTTSSTSTSISTASTTTTTTSTTTSTTSTTTLCGGEFQKPCYGGACNNGCVLDSEGLCQKPKCAPSKSSGRDGCGGFALSYCSGDSLL